MSNKKLCYNRGCNQEFDPENNPEGSCWYHPGRPVFHDAYKGWSCCEKKSTDFTDFLNFKGCQSSKHSSEKPLLPSNDDEQDDSENFLLPPKKVEQEETRGPMYVPKERPSVDAHMIDLPRTVSESLKNKLKAFDVKDSIVVEGESKDSEAGAGNVLVDTPCNNKGCRESYGPNTSSVCVYHSGYPVFHEGMKFWTCCKKRTSDFDAFLAQVGCESGRHLWTKPEVSPGDIDKSKACRFDWHQTESHVYITIYSKLPYPGDSIVKMNEVKVSIFVTFGEEKIQFEKVLVLYGIVDPSSSQVIFAPTKVELCLKKSEPIHWLDIELKE